MKPVKVLPVNVRRGHRPLHVDGRTRAVPEERWRYGVEPDPRQGRRPLLELKWLDLVPGRKALTRVNILWFGLDKDSPTVTKSGVLEEWRKPFFALPVMAAVLHALGWPCRWRAIPDVEQIRFCLEDWPRRGQRLRDVERDDLNARCWHLSNPERLRFVEPWDVPLLQGWSRGIDHYLPPSGPQPAPNGRAFGRRRGVKMYRPTVAYRRREEKET